jgi:hypothetical protein
MTRAGTSAFDTEATFLKECAALVDRELAYRARAVSRHSPELASAVTAAVATPARDWPAAVNAEIVMAFHGLKLEQALVAELLDEIADRPLVDALDRRIARVERHEADLVQYEPNGTYLGDRAYWDDEDALVVLNRLFTNWARWARAEPLEGP